MMFKCIILTGRLTHFPAEHVFCQKRVPDTELLFEDKRHLRYFDTEEEFFDLADWYLKHGDERRKMADAGMEFAHQEYNCAKMARYFIELVENGTCSAPWNYVI